MEQPSLREAEVLELVGRHLSNRQIAERLYISVRTVESHVASLIRKLGVADRQQLVAYAAEHDGATAVVPDSRARTNLPLARSSFVGRKAEGEQLHPDRSFRAVGHPHRNRRLWEDEVGVGGGVGTRGGFRRRRLLC